MMTNCCVDSFSHYDFFIHDYHSIQHIFIIDYINGSNEFENKVLNIKEEIDDLWENIINEIKGKENECESFVSKKSFS